MPLTPFDTEMMARALHLAERGLYTTMPNPRVGCILVLEGTVVGEGWHIKAGEGHAEVNALAAAGDKARGATAYVTLEPCSFTGLTGPCCQALIDAGVSRVVYGMEDPNPKVSGEGNERLREAGIVVDGPLLEEAARKVNPGFIQRMERRRPFIRVKSAMSLDGRTAMANGESKWITAPQARSDVQRLRARSCAVISGIETVIKDMASLTVRADELGIADAKAAAEKQPLRVVLDSKLRLPRDSQLVSIHSPILIAYTEASPEQCQGWPDHVSLIHLPGRDGRVDLPGLIKELAARQCNEVLVEAGARVSASFLRQGLLDEMIVYMAPKLMGSEARPLFELPLQSMAAQLPLFISDIRPIGQDWRITARPDFDG